MQVRVHHIESITPTVKTVWFTSEKKLRYEAGQFIELQQESDDFDLSNKKRWFTLSSSPTEELLAITTKISTVEKMSRFKSALVNAQPGTSFQMSEPMGDFILPRNPERSLLFVTAGIGVTPLRSMSKYLYDTGQSRPIYSIYSVRDDEAAFQELLKSVSKKFELIITNKGDRLTASAVLERLKDLHDPLVYISGPERLVETLYASLKENFDQSSIVTDYFHGY